MQDIGARRYPNDAGQPALSRKGTLDAPSSAVAASSHVRAAFPDSAKWTPWYTSSSRVGSHPSVCRVLFSFSLSFAFIWRVMDCCGIIREESRHDGGKEARCPGYGGESACGEG